MKTHWSNCNYMSWRIAPRPRLTASGVVVKTASSHWEEEKKLARWTTFTRTSYCWDNVQRNRRSWRLLMTMMMVLVVMPANLQLIITRRCMQLGLGASILSPNLRIIRCLTAWSETRKTLTWKIWHRSVLRIKSHRIQKTSMAIYCALHPYPLLIAPKTTGTGQTRWEWRRIGLILWWTLRTRSKWVRTRRNYEEAINRRTIMSWQASWWSTLSQFCNQPWNR